MEIVLHALAVAPLFLFAALYIIKGPQPYHMEIFHGGQNNRRELQGVLRRGFILSPLYVILCVAGMLFSNPDVAAWGVGIFLVLLMVMGIFKSLKEPFDLQALAQAIWSTGVRFVTLGVTYVICVGVSFSSGESWRHTLILTLFYLYATTESRGLGKYTGVNTPWKPALAFTLLSAAATIGLALI